ncbi:CotH kinase family protein [Ligilactobacillus salivarius]|uniref:CotH kinase family protein n=1 Tax=Ligilactobacillus salivarius TaxID=1624 RepID=UPI00195C4DBC|nr:CotH kinase family protein [Ligilactobacillus salivarius]MBM6786912.1 CotH kinase family protein [Ligilactobacillus salivarius]
MANKFTTKVTNEGLNLLQLASQQDKKVEFINVIASSTAYSENQLISETYDDINSRASKNQTGTINNLTIDKNITKMELVFDGHDIKSDYTLNSIFLIAKLKDSQDLKLFAIIKANQPQYMNSYDGSGSTNLQINLGVKFSNNDKVTLQIDTAAIATLADLSNLRNETQAKIDNKLSQIKLYTEAFENGDAIKQAYPDGKTGIFIAIDTGHQWYWLNGAWKDAGPYQDNTSIKDFVDNYLSDIAHKDSDGKFKLNLDNTLTSETMPTSAKRVGELFKFNFRNYSKTYSWYDFKGKIPIIELQGTLPADASQKNSLSYKYKIFEGTATLKWQGQSSLAFPKKNFTIKFDKKFTAKDGWLADDTYVLKGNFNDFSQARNVVSAEIWAKIVKSRNWNYVPLADNDGSLIVDNTTNGFNVYEDIMPGLHGTGAVDGFPVMLVVNGEYCGLYSFVLKKKAETFGFGNSNLEYALSCERTPDNQNRNSVAFKGLADLDGKDFDFEYTKSDKDEANAKVSFNNMISKVIEATGEGYESVIENYLDIDSVIDYMIFTSLISAADGITKNYLMLSYDGVKWYFSAYDLDCTFGNWQDGWLSQQPSGIPTLADWNRSNRAMHLVYAYGKDRLKARYKELRDGILSVENVRRMFIDYVSNISHALKDEELKLWPQTPSSEVHNINQIVEHYRLRAEFIDKEIESL